MQIEVGGVHLRLPWASYKVRELITAERSRHRGSAGWGAFLFSQLMYTLASIAKYSFMMMMMMEYCFKYNT